METLQLVYRALTGDAELRGLVADRVFEHVPARARMPYVVLGEVVTRPWDTASDRGRLDDITVHVWSRGSSRADVAAAAHRIERALRFENLASVAESAAAAPPVNVVRGERRIERLPERDLVHATLRFRLTREDQA